MQPPNTRIADRIFFYGSIFAACFALFMHYGLAKTRIQKDDWKKPSQFIKNNFQKGDAIVLLPSWILEGAATLRQEFNKDSFWKDKSLPILYPATIKEADFSLYKRVWVLHAPFVGKWWFRRSFQESIAFLKKLAWKKQHKVFPQLEVSLFQLAKFQGWSYDFSKKKYLQTAEVGLEKPSRSFRRGRCSRSPLSEVSWLKRYNPSKGWFEGRRRYFFGKLIQEIGNTPRDCLWAMPRRCRILRVRYRNVPLRGEFHLGHGIGTAAPGGLASGIKQVEHRVFIDVFVNQKKVKTYSVHRHEHWKKHVFSFQKVAKNKETASVEFQIYTKDLRHHFSGYCFKARILRPSKKK